LQSPQPSLNATSTSHRLNNKANEKVKKKICGYSKQKILNIFDNPEQSNKEEYQEFIVHVVRLANQQTERAERAERERERERLHDFNSQTVFCVAHADYQKICAVNLLSLLQNDWLSDSIINFVGKVLQRKWERSIHVYSTHFMFRLLSDDTMNSFQYSNVSQWHKKIKAYVKFLYIPIHVDGNHWMLCCLNFSKKKILLWNSSSQTSDNNKYLQALKKYIGQVVQSLSASPTNKKWKGRWSMDDKSMSSPQQGIFDDCGIFVILNMVLLSSGVPLTEYSYSQFEINRCKTRERIAQIIFENIHWEGFVTDDIEDQQWLSFINRMKVKGTKSQDSWSWVNETTAHK